MGYGERIRKLRKKRSLSQKELAEKLGKNVKQANVSSWEKSTYPPLEVIEKICTAMDITITDFFADGYNSGGTVISEECLDLAIEIDRLTPEKKNLFLKHILSGLHLIEY